MNPASDSPLLEFDEERTSFIEPSRWFRKGEIPERVVLCFMNSALKKAAQEGAWPVIGRLGNESESWPIYRSESGGIPVAVAHPGIGAPLSAAHLEELIAMGCRTFLACGGAGALDRNLAVGHLLLVERAVRDEGTSLHYLPASREVGASEELVSAIARFLEEENVPHKNVKTWTTDAMYRETASRISRRIEEGCTIVEMECSALFAVAEFRKVRGAALLYSGDDCSGSEWDSRGWQTRKDLRGRLLDLAIRCCARI